MTKNGPGFGRAKNGIPFAPYLERPLTLVPCSLLRNRTETLAVQVTSSQDQSQTESQKHVAQHKKGGKHRQKYDEMSTLKQWVILNLSLKRVKHDMLK